MQQQLHPIFKFDELVSDRSVQGLLSSFMTRHAPKSILVNTFGGLVESLTELASSIERHEVNTIADHVGGCGLVLALLGKKRLAFPDSTFYFSEVSTLIYSDGSIALTSLSDVRRYAEIMAGTELEAGYGAWLQEMASAQDWLLTFVQRRIQIPVAQVLDLMKGNVTLGTADAIRYGFVDEVIPRELTYDA